MTAEFLRTHLGLEPLPGEGGYYAETYRSVLRWPAGLLPPRYGSPRDGATAIYYLLTPDTFSVVHRLPGDEIYHFYLGDPVELLQLRPDGTGAVVTMGSGLAEGQRCQVVVPGGTWQGSRLAPGGRYALLGTTMTPGFAFEDFEAGRRDALRRRYPAFADWIDALTGPQDEDPST